MEKTIAGLEQCVTGVLVAVTRLANVVPANVLSSGTPISMSPVIPLSSLSVVTPSPSSAAVLPIFRLPVNVDPGLLHWSVSHVAPRSPALSTSSSAFELDPAYVAVKKLHSGQTLTLADPISPSLNTDVIPHDL